MNTLGEFWNLTHTMMTAATVVFGLGLESNMALLYEKEESWKPETQQAYEEQTRSLVEQLAREGITQNDLESSTPVMQDFAEGKISEEQARSRLIRVADGKLVKFLSNRLFQNFFRRADPADFITALSNRGFETTRLQELQTEINFYFRPQTETRAAHWEFLTNTLFIPVEFCQAGTRKIRSDLKPHELSVLIHELDHADKDLRTDLLRFRGKSLGGKIHAGICWGAILCLVGLISTTVLGSLHRLSRWFPMLQRTSRFGILTIPQVALGVVAGSAAIGVSFALVYQLISPSEFSDLRKTEQENLLQITRLSNIINADARQEMGTESARMAHNKMMPRITRDAIRFGALGALAGGTLGLLLGLAGLGPRLLGQLRILRKLNYAWAMAITCALIGGLSFGIFGAWQNNRFAKFKAWEISAYYAGHCAQRVLEGERDIAYHNTKLLYGLSSADLEQLRLRDEKGEFKLLLPRRMYRMPPGQKDLPENSLDQLRMDFSGEFEQPGNMGHEFRAFLLGTEIEFAYTKHPQIFRSLFRTSLGLGLGSMTRDRARNEFNYRGLADFIERSKLDRHVQIRHQVRQARAERNVELLRQQPNDQN